MQYTYLVPQTQQELYERKWTDIRWDIERHLHIVITQDIKMQPGPGEGILLEDGTVVDGIPFTIPLPRELTTEEKAWLDDHMAHKERWGTLDYPVHAQRNDDPEYIAEVLQRETNGKCFFRGFHGQALHIGCERELTDAEKDALKILGDIVWK